MGVFDTLLSLSIPALVLVHLAAAPYTKVEESFNMQATHDVLVYGTPTADVARKLAARYDHFAFPGAVPRTFTGPIFLAGLAQPLLALVGFARAQLVVRALLGLFNAVCLVYFQRRLRRVAGPAAACWYALLQASQFHVLFYASRTLPNMFAFGLTTLAFAQLLGDPRQLKPGQCRLAISLLTYATAVFRSELAILLSSTTLYLLLTGAITVRKVIPAFVITFVFALLSSVPLDSYFWQKPIWPELWGFYYNAVLGSSSEWGVSPWHYYFTNALPKLMINPLTLTVLVPYALSTKATAKPAEALTVPSILFVAIYSLQPHKEARFIFYVVPPLTAVAALAANYIFTRRAKSLVYRFGSLVLVASVLASFAISTGMLLVSSLNYPGGEALSELRGLVAAAGASPDTNTVTVHTDVLSCMTGVTLFGQHPYPPNEVRPSSEAVSFHFDKTERSSALRNPAFWNKFDYVLVEDPSQAIGPWETVGVVQGFAGVELLRPEAPEPNDDVERGEGPVLGRGALLQKARERVRSLTGGWWIGPRMEPQIRILKRLRAAPRREVTE